MKAIILLSLLAACSSDPLRGVERLSDIDLAEGGAVTALPDAAERSPEGGLVAGREAGAAVPRAAAPQGGVLGYFSRQAEAAKAGSDGEVTRAAIGGATLDDLSEDGAQVAALPRQSAPQQSGGGFLSSLFGGGGGSSPQPGAPDYAQVGPGETLPYGELARLCGAPERLLGSRVATYPENRGGYALYDSEPGRSTPHTFFITGFDDGCARQFTAAFALFSAPSDFEKLRYGLPSETVPSSRTDAAYETLKTQVCRVGKGQPCGARIGRLEKNTAFVSIYETFGSNARWKTVLLHEGEVLAADLKGN